MRLAKDEVLLWRSSDGVEITSCHEHDIIDDGSVLLHLRVQIKILTITMPKGFGTSATLRITQLESATRSEDGRHYHRKQPRVPHALMDCACLQCRVPRTNTATTGYL
jgi:hypothetical protein